MNGILVVIAIFILDLILGDPEVIPHPVRLMGRVIEEAEGLLRSKFPKTEDGAFKAGLVLAIALPLVTFAATGLVILITYSIWKPLGIAIQIFWGWQAIAMRDMLKESDSVHEKVTEGDLSGARAAVGRIVGRDTQKLGMDGVIRATVETVAESFSDGFFAPLFYFAIGGAPLALANKAINTMDSMIGYKNEEYMYFGRAAAKLDDVANFIPARISAFLMMAAAGLCGFDEKAAYRIWKRDRKLSTSPNSGQTESAMAGALHVRLLGPTWYFGQLSDKPWIGDDIRPVEAYDIKRANKIFVISGIIGVAVACIIVIIL
ncbi:MAG: adenosylcobinamide-phosphate synthase CbiB [Lachnospiraceae bacterium]|nr:adenosylcobinamide-phosphate synthase CbiB [Lachnospiraceae bacterium]